MVSLKLYHGDVYHVMQDPEVNIIGDGKEVPKKTKTPGKRRSRTQKKKGTKSGSKASKSKAKGDKTVNNAAGSEHGEPESETTSDESEAELLTDFL